MELVVGSPAFRQGGREVVEDLEVAEDLGLAGALEPQGLEPIDSKNTPICTTKSPSSGALGVVIYRSKDLVVGECKLKILAKTSLIYISTSV